MRLNWPSLKCGGNFSKEWSLCKNILLRNLFLYVVQSIHTRGDCPRRGCSKSRPLFIRCASKLSKFLDPGEFEAENRRAVSIKMQKYVVTRILRESQEIVEHDREVEEESMPCAFHLLFVFGEIYSEGNETIGIRSSANCYGLSIGRVQWRN